MILEVGAEFSFESGLHGQGRAVHLACWARSSLSATSCLPDIQKPIDRGFEFEFEFLSKVIDRKYPY